MTPHELAHPPAILRRTTFGRSERNARPASTMGTRNSNDEDAAAVLHALPLRVVPRERLLRVIDEKDGSGS